jgi:hypothetical protein
LISNACLYNIIFVNNLPPHLKNSGSTTDSTCVVVADATMNEAGQGKFLSSCLFFFFFFPFLFFFYQPTERYSRDMSDQSWSTAVATQDLGWTVVWPLPYPTLLGPTNSLLSTNHVAWFLVAFGFGQSLSIFHPIRSSFSFSF